MINKRILVITNNWLDDFGGRKIVVKKITNYLVNKYQSISMLSFEVNSTLNNRNNYNPGLNKQIAFYPVFLSGNKKIPIEIIKFSKKNKFDLIICCSWSAIDLISIAVIKLYRLFPHAIIILFEHSNPIKSIYTSRLWLFYKLLGKLLYRIFDYIVVPNNDLKNTFINNFFVSNKKIQTLNLPIVNNKIKSLSKEKVKKPFFYKPNILKIVTLARLNLAQKDFNTLFKAFKNILNFKNNAVLIVLGEGPDKNKIIQLAKKLNIDGSVKFLGFQNNPFKYISKSDVFVLSSFYESFGVALVEALACKIPVISTDCDYGPRDILEGGKNGLLVPVGDAEKMTQAIVSIIEDKNLKNELLKNAEKITGDYLEEKSFNSWLKFLKRV